MVMIVFFMHNQSIRWALGMNLIKVMKLWEDNHVRSLVPMTKVVKVQTQRRLFIHYDTNGQYLIDEISQVSKIEILAS